MYPSSMVFTQMRLMPGLFTICSGRVFAFGKALHKLDLGSVKCFSANVISRSFFPHMCSPFC